MSHIFTLSCPTCGGKLEITSDIDRFACGHCGNEHIVKRGGGIVSLSPVVDKLTDVQIGVDKTASELAINRLRVELTALEQEYAAVNNANEALKGRGKLTYTIGWIWIAFVIVYGVSQFASVDKFLCISLMLLGIGVGGVGFFQASRLERDAKSADEALDNIMAVAKQKQAELRQHERIVSS